MTASNLSANQEKQTESNHHVDQVSFFGKMLTFSRMKLFTNDFEMIAKQLEIVSPTKDSLIPIVIDSEVDLDLKDLIDLLWDFGLQPIGVTKGKLDKQAKELRLAIFPADGKRMQRVNTSSVTTNRKVVPATNSHDNETDNSADKIKAENSKSEKLEADKPFSSVAENKKEKVTSKNQSDKLQVTEGSCDIRDNSINIQDESSELIESKDSVQVIQVVEQVTSLVYDQMLRSGQSINHVGGDLVLTNSVNDGAEAITDNSLHIYGRGMGRLVAGATGDQNAHIFCQRFNPSLVSVAGTYMLRDSIPTDVIDKPVQVSYKKGEGLVFRVMDDWLPQSTNIQGMISAR